MKRIKLGNRRKKVEYAIVDDEDFEKLSFFRWHLGKDGYAVRTYYIQGVRNKNGKLKAKQVRMHRAIMSPKDNMVVDHINHNILDNRKENLRICSTKENVRNHRGPSKNNTSGFIGVSWCKTYKKWNANITADKKKKNIGYFRNISDAIKARDEAAKKYHKEFASLNAI